MSSWLTDIFGSGFGNGRKRKPSLAAATGDDEAGSRIRYRPRLVAELAQEHEAACRHMRGVLDACRSQDEDAQIASLREFSDAFRRSALRKSVQLYPYLDWALEGDRTAIIQFRAIRADVDRCTLGIEAIVSDYLGGPWTRETRQRLLGQMIRAARLFGQILRQEEPALFPLYLPPGQASQIAGKR